MKRIFLATAGLALAMTLTQCCGTAQKTADDDSMPLMKGTVSTFNYDVTDGTGGTISKTAQVYVPQEYDKTDTAKKYNVLYLAHGGGDNQGSFFDPQRSPQPLDAVMDSLTTAGLAEPMIIVCPTYYTGTDDPHKDMQSTIDDCRRFHAELRDFLIPAIEREYNVFTTREHRAYGGFSMGSLSTWYQLAYGTDEVKYYIPLSGDLWVYDDDGQKVSAAEAAGWLQERLAAIPYGKHDVSVWGYTGSRDIACRPENALVGELMQHDGLLEYGVNLRYSVFEGGDHQYKYINQYLAEVIPSLFRE